MKVVYFLSAALAFPAAVRAQDGGAFGVRMAQSLATLTVKKKMDDHTFTVSVPTPHREFEEYMVIATPETGVCKVSGVGKTHTSDNYGTATRSAFNALKGVLSARYGRSKDFDFLEAGSIWNDARDFHMGVLKRERHLDSFWDADERSTLPPSIVAIQLGTSAVSSGPYLGLSYEFANFGRCKAIFDREDNAGL